VIRARGEQVETVAPALALWAALILPDLQCPTAAIYAAWDRLPPAPPRPAPRDVLAARGSASELMERLFNDLEPAAFNVAPALRELAARASEAGGQPVRVTGSGAALFRLFDDAEAAARFALAVATALDTRVDVVALRT
jgi:4-diphosphocytidyl-2C-methyl-D-erythritol kinase